MYPPWIRGDHYFPLSVGDDASQDLQWMVESTSSTEPCIYYWRLLMGMGSQRGEIPSPTSWHPLLAEPLEAKQK